jgi:transposase
VIVLGVDPHKDTHTIVAVDGAAGHPLAQLTVAARTAGHQKAIAWAQALGEHRWAVEDCRHVSGRLERDLLALDERVVRVPPKLMAERRRSGRSYGKSDPIDALAVARAALEHPELAAPIEHEADRDLGLLLDYRDDLVAERTRLENRLRWQLHDLDPDLDVPPRGLDRRVVVERVRRRLTGLDQTVQVRLARGLLRRIVALTREAQGLESEIAERTAVEHPQLLKLPGCGPLTAAKIVAETAGASRFASFAQFAMYAGVAPLDCSSGRHQRHRLNRYGNRQLNAALHRMALTQVRVHAPARTLYERKQAEGKSRREALRVLKWHLARCVYRILTQPVRIPLT